MGAYDFGATVSPSTFTASPLRNVDPDLIFEDAQEDFQDFHLSPFTINQSSDDHEALMKKGLFKALNE